MKINLIKISGVALVTTAVGMSSATAQTFGTIPGAAAGAYGNTYQDKSEVTQTTGLADGDTLTLAEEVTPHDTALGFNAVPGDNGAGTYYVKTGFGNTPGRSTWDFDFYAGSSMGLLGNYTFSLTELNVGNGQTVTFNPGPAVFTDDTGNGSDFFGNEESLDFPFAGGIGYNPNLPDTYTFTLAASENGVQVASDTITVVASAPDSGSTLALAGMGLAAVAFARRRLAARA